VVFVPGPREVTEASWNVFCAATVATSLTGPIHWSDWCHQSDGVGAIGLTGVAQAASRADFDCAFGVFWFGRLCVGSYN
jgi:hypothetical protein